MTPTQIVEHGAAAFAELDRALEAARLAALRIEEVIRDGVSEGMVKALKGKEMLHASRAMTGQIAAAGLSAARLHQDCTAVAKANGVDTAAPVSVAGVTLKSGGGR